STDRTYPRHVSPSRNHANQAPSSKNDLASPQPCTCGARLTSAAAADPSRPYVHRHPHRARDDNTTIIATGRSKCQYRPPGTPRKARATGRRSVSSLPALLLPRRLVARLVLVPALLPSHLLLARLLLGGFLRGFGFGGERDHGRPDQRQRRG